MRSNRTDIKPTGATGVIRRKSLIKLRSTSSVLATSKTLLRPPESHFPNLAPGTSLTIWLDVERSSYAPFYFYYRMNGAGFFLCWKSWVWSSACLQSKVFGSFIKICFNFRKIHETLFTVKFCVMHTRTRCLHN